MKSNDGIEDKIFGSELGISVLSSIFLTHRLCSYSQDIGFADDSILCSSFISCNDDLTLRRGLSYIFI